MANPEFFNPEGLALSNRYARTMDALVRPRLDAARTDVSLAGDGGRPLFCSRFDAERPQGTVLIVHGFTENVEKYAELIHSLLQNGFSVLAYDQRGHGRSWRAKGLNGPSLTHVGRFDEYVHDLEIVCDQLLAQMPKPWVLFSHSMGGAVSALFLERRADGFERAVLSSPMIAPNLGGVPLPLARLLCRGARALGQARRRMFFSRPYAGPEDFETSCATGRERFDWYEALRTATPAFQNNGPTYGWTLEAMNVTDRILAPGAPERIACPVRLYTAALDGTVLPGPQAAFIRRVPRGERQVVEGAKHEIFRSTDAVLFPWWRGVLEYLKGERA